MTPEEVKTLNKVLSEIQKKLMSELFDRVDGDVSELIDGMDVYAIGDKLGLSRDEIYRYSISLGKRGLLEIYPTFGGRETAGAVISAVQLTTNGADFVILTR
jgi:hypothetical protein